METIISIICILFSFGMAETAKGKRHDINKKYLAHLREEKVRNRNNPNGVK